LRLKLEPLGKGQAANHALLCLAALPKLHGKGALRDLLKKIRCGKANDAHTVIDALGESMPGALQVDLSDPGDFMAALVWPMFQESEFELLLTCIGFPTLCKPCHGVRGRHVDDHVVLWVHAPLQEEEDLQNALRESCLHCGVPRERIPAVNSGDGPDYAVIGIKRVENKVRNNCFVRYPLKDCVGISEHRKYDLKAVVLMFGGILSKHFVTLVKLGDSGHWFRFEEFKPITLISDDLVEDPNAYLLVYQGQARKHKIPH
jgi:hypothetical protein